MVGEGSYREQWRLLHSLLVFSHSLHYPQSNWAPLVLIPEWVGLCTLLWVSPTTSPVRLGVSPAAASTPMGVFNQRFEALFPHAGDLGCMVCFVPPPFLPVYLCANVGPQGLLAVPLPTSSHNPPPWWVHQPPLHCESSLPQLPVSTPPTGLDECFFFISLVVGLPCSSIFCQFWLFLFLICCCPFGCARRRSMSTYTSILAGRNFVISS